MSRLIDFYRGEAADPQGRGIADLWALDDDDMESIHDFIQWMFPLPEPSRFNPEAPLVSGADVRAFLSDPGLRESLTRSFRRFLAFLGLAVDAGGSVVEGPDFGRKQGVFLRPNHNWLRITRVLASARLLGLEGESRAFFRFLDDRREAGSFPIPDDTFRYWSDAAGP